MCEQAAGRERNDRNLSPASQERTEVTSSGATTRFRGLRSSHDLRPLIAGRARSNVEDDVAAPPATRLRELEFLERDRLDNVAGPAELAVHRRP